MSLIGIKRNLSRMHVTFLIGKKWNQTSDSRFDRSNYIRRSEYQFHDEWSSIVKNQKSETLPTSAHPSMTSLLYSYWHHVGSMTNRRIKFEQCILPVSRTTRHACKRSGIINVQRVTEKDSKPIKNYRFISRRQIIDNIKKECWMSWRKQRNEKNLK